MNHRTKTATISNNSTGSILVSHQLQSFVPLFMAYTNAALNSSNHKITFYRYTNGTITFDNGTGKSDKNNMTVVKSSILICIYIRVYVYMYVHNN